MKGLQQKWEIRIKQKFSDNLMHLNRALVYTSHPSSDRVSQTLLDKYPGTLNSALYHRLSETYASFY